MKCKCNHEMKLVLREEHHTTGSFQKYYLCTKCNAVDIIYSNRRKASPGEVQKTINSYGGIL